MGFSYFGDVGSQGLVNFAQGDVKGGFDPGGFWDKLNPKKGPGEESASDTWARITQEQYDDATQTYQPIEDYLKGVVNNPMERATAVQGARNLADSSFQGIEGSIQRRLAGYGATQTPEQAASTTRQIGLQRSLADVDAGNRANQAVTDRDQQLAGGGIATSAGTLASIKNQQQHV